MIIVIRMKKTWIEWGEDLFIYIFMFEKYHKTAHKINSRQRHYLFCFNHFSSFTLVERKHPKYISSAYFIAHLYLRFQSRSISVKVVSQKSPFQQLYTHQTLQFYNFTATKRNKNLNLALSSIQISVLEIYIMREEQNTKLC